MANDKPRRSREPRKQANKRNSTDANRRLGATEQESAATRNEQNEVFNPNSTGGYISREEDIGGGTGNPGKILECLKLIEQKHLSYVKSHQVRLEAELEMSRQNEEDFKQSVRQLEARIAELLVQPE